MVMVSEAPHQRPLSSRLAGAIARDDAPRLADMSAEVESGREGGLRKGTLRDIQVIPHKENAQT